MLMTDDQLHETVLGGTRRLVYRVAELEEANQKLEERVARLEAVLIGGNDGRP